ncbi:hypothetical protein ACQEV9_17970 [Streptomyces chartreusis]|uniref:hypothetical protein n=1 Tax=Streptomyces chartreusis TaxID=1969 RepID=UPI003D9425F8
MTQDASGQSTERRHPDVQMKFVSALPDGRAVVPAEQEGKFIWLIAEGAMTDQCRREMRDYLRHIVRSGMWTQNWPDPRTC